MIVGLLDGRCFVEGVLVSRLFGSGGLMWCIAN